MILQQLKISIQSLLVLSAICGVIYPVVMTGIAQVVFPRAANGSLMIQDGKIIGSTLIGQSFGDPGHFWSRLSATSPMAYNASGSSGSNLGPTNPALITEIQGQIDALQKADPTNTRPIPIDLVTSSASGLDPHITPAAADYQLDRVARVTGISKDRVRQLIDENTEGRFLGLFGEPSVNVLTLNVALDHLKK